MLSLPVSHRQQPKRQPGQKQLFTADEVRTVVTVKSWATKYLGDRWFPPCWPVRLHVVPSDGVIRAVAYESVRRYRKKTPQIPLFSRVLRAYIGLITGRHKDRHKVEEYLVRKLKGHVAEYRRNRWCLKNPMTRKDLEDVAKLFLSDVELEILQLVADGRAIGEEDPRGYLYVHSRTREGSRQCIFTLGATGRTEKRPILCLQAPALFDRGKNRKLRRRGDDYRNYHPMLRR
jgi:hypothetical protein